MGRYGSDQSLDNGQRIVFNGHKRVHGLKFQSIALPNGLIGNIFGPVGKNLNISLNINKISYNVIHMGSEI